MDRIAHAVRWFVEVLLRPLDHLAPWASLAVVGAVTGLVMLVVVRRTSPQRLIGRARAQMAAALYEMRLYLDHPGRVLAAQGRMIGWTVVYLACLLPSLLVLAAPLGLLYLHLEIRHGVAPLPAPSTIVLRVELAEGASTRDVTLEPRGDVRITARVRADDEPAVYARLAIGGPGAHEVIVRAGGVAVSKRLDAAPGADVVSPERRAGLAHAWTLGAEPPIDDGPIRALSVAHPDRDSTLPVPWWLYWLAAATVVALALRRRFDVVF